MKILVEYYNGLRFDGRLYITTKNGIPIWEIAMTPAIVNAGCGTSWKARIGNGGFWFSSVRDGEPVQPHEIEKAMKTLREKHNQKLEEAKQLQKELCALDALREVTK